jgi:adenylate kinase family enzyme
VDDQPEVVRERLKVYREASEPVVEFYRAKSILKNIRNDDANADPNSVVQQILEAIS